MRERKRVPIYHDPGNLDPVFDSPQAVQPGTVIVADRQGVRAALGGDEDPLPDQLLDPVTSLYLRVVAGAGLDAAPPVYGRIRLPIRPRINTSVPSG